MLPYTICLVMLQADDKGVLYPVAQILVNVTNSYDIKQPEPELVEIAKFAKQHIPETHEKVIIPQLCLSSKSAALSPYICIDPFI